ncbi:hypothetical protein [Streptomyces sp. MUM 178J]|uniref:hypothetical protein n=1 Tax=Streptomyces sp. MUM 178J TaxID=2791991 RepID=UPI001F047D02|nr:hypothetical protein [Streptomyces sp. MUM 178J]WRQ78914.1 hypothetical protein I3F59_005705 [Streptomyces sp. MUM 178J]
MRLLETACAISAVLLAALLVLATDHATLLAAYHNGALTRALTLLTAVCAAWLLLRRKRTGRPVPACLAVPLLVLGACTLTLAARTL